MNTIFAYIATVLHSLFAIPAHPVPGRLLHLLCNCCCNRCPAQQDSLAVVARTRHRETQVLRSCDLILCPAIRGGPRQAQSRGAEMQRRGGSKQLWEMIRITRRRIFGRSSILQILCTTSSP